MGMLEEVREKIFHRRYEFSKHAVDQSIIMKETIVETEVTYTVAHRGQFYIIEHVPARVCKETGEQFFSPETVERIQAMIKGEKKPDRLIETPVFEYA
jgi:YgiT-type zinc finger domain-containing protein